MNKVLDFLNKLFSGLVATGLIGLICAGIGFVAESLGWWLTAVVIVLFTIKAYIKEK